MELLRKMKDMCFLGNHGSYGFRSFSGERRAFDVRRDGLEIKGNGDFFGDQTITTTDFLGVHWGS